MTATADTAVRAGDPLLDQGIRAVNFFNGRLVTSRDLMRDQEARREGDARLGQAIGAGVVRGLEVQRAAGNRRLQVFAGLAVNRAGQTLCLGADQVLALVPQADEAAPETSGGFGACTTLTGGSYVAGDGLYIVALAPASRPDGKAEVLALEPGNLRCNSDVVVEAVQLRLLHVRQGVLDAHGLDSNAIAPRAVSLLRSAAAAACFGQAQRAAAHASPGAPAAKNLLEDMEDYGLAQCDVPLALVYLNAVDGLVFVDRWAVRRQVAARVASAAWSPWFGEPGQAVAQAQLAQFQEQLADIPAASLSGIKAHEWFGWLPPAGFLDATGARAVQWQAFLDARAPRVAVALAPGDAPAVLAEALGRDAVPLAAGGADFRVYRIGSGPWLFVRDAPNARHAEETWLDGGRAQMPGVHDVQEAIDQLWARSCDQLVLRPRDGEGAARALLRRAKEGEALMLCVEAGTLKLSEPLVLEGLGHVTIHGHGAGSLLHCESGEVALRLERCASVTVAGIALRADQPGPGRTGKGPGRGGALTVVDTPVVHVERVTAQCGDAAELGSAAIVVTHRDGESDGRRRVHVACCELRVGRGQQGLACIHCDLVTVRDNVITAADPKAPMRGGIVVAGVVAREVCVERNLVQGAHQGIVVALSRSETEEDKEYLSVENVAVLGNRVHIAAAEDFDRRIPCFGIFIGNAQSVLVQANRVAATELLEELQASGLRLHGQYEWRLLVRDNHFSEFMYGIELAALEVAQAKGELLWVVEGNLVVHGRDILRVEEAVGQKLRRDNNVLA